VKGGKVVGQFGVSGSFYLSRIGVVDVLEMSQEAIEALDGQVSSGRNWVKLVAQDLQISLSNKPDRILQAREC